MKNTLNHQTRTKPSLKVFNKSNKDDFLSSNISGFYELSLSQRLAVIAKYADLSTDEVASLENFGSLDKRYTKIFIENSIANFSLPLGIATNFKINNVDYLVPMAVEETSVLAAASHGAKLARTKGGFFANSTDPIMTGQIQMYPKDANNIDTLLCAQKKTLLAYANYGQDSLVARGGGTKDLDWYYIEEINSLVIQVHVNTADAMGANIVNTICERLSKVVQELIPGKMGLRILTNLNIRRFTEVKCTVEKNIFSKNNTDGEQVVDAIVDAYLFAKHDIYRATTNNKGVMNGIDPVVIATGNDWRAIEAGAHAYVSMTGKYQPMAKWSKNSEGNLEGYIKLPMALGTVGGVTKLHPTAKIALKILNSPDAKTLANIITSVGLAQNLSALRALATEGIQHGHMRLHKQNNNLLKEFSKQQ